MECKVVLYDYLEEFSRMTTNAYESASIIVKAVRTNNVSRLIRLRRQKYVFLETYSQDNSILHIAVIFGSLSALDYLLKIGEVHVNNRNNMGWTALFMASAFARDLSSVKRLILAGADPALPDLRNITSLDFLLNFPQEMHSETVSIMQQLIKYPPFGGNTLVHSAAVSDSEQLSTLIADGVDLNIQVFGGITPLHMATYLEFTRSINQLLTAGVNLNAKTKFGMTPLNLTVNGNGEITSQLIAAGADLNIKDTEGYTPLHNAVHLTNYKTVSLLLNAGADINCYADNGETALHEAIAHPSEDSLPIANLLIKMGADIDLPDDDGYTPLHKAAGLGKYEASAMLLYYGADANRTNSSNYSPLMVAIEGNYDHLQNLLFNYEVNMNRESISEESLLALACRCHSPLIWDILDRGGMMVPVTNNDCDILYRSEECQEPDIFW